MSMLPPASVGEIVRRAGSPGRSGGTDEVGFGSSTNPPSLATRCSADLLRSNNSRDGATPITPMKGAPGNRTPGRSTEVANPSAISQRTM